MVQFLVLLYSVGMVTFKSCQHWFSREGVETLSLENATEHWASKGVPKTKNLSLGPHGFSMFSSDLGWNFATLKPQPEKGERNGHHALAFSKHSRVDLFAIKCCLPAMPHSFDAKQPCIGTCFQVMMGCLCEQTVPGKYDTSTSWKFVMASNGAGPRKTRQDYLQLIII